MFTLNCKGKILSLETPVVMGIINITPDSFYKGHLNEGSSLILGLAKKMIAEGAVILDIGGQSTRPGSEPVTVQQELERVIPVIQMIRDHFDDIIMSVDTYYSEVAEKAVKAGARMVNDISAGEIDPAMIKTVASLQVPYICMHMKGTPATMHQNISYEDVTKELIDFFSSKISVCQKEGISDVIIDPGFGFGKKIEHNLQLLKELEVFKLLGKPILAGLSRKSTIYKTLDITVGEALNGTTVLNTLALNNGADILRVHDVKEAVEAVKLLNAYKKVASW